MANRSGPTVLLVQFLVQLLASSITLSKLLNPVGLSFLPCNMGIHPSGLSRGLNAIV
jgi:hypothetical protein